MVGMFGEKVSLSQANGPDVELVVRGTELYATYETADGFPAVYDDTLGLFCYAELDSGSFQSTGVAVTLSPPQGLERRASESDEVRKQKVEARKLQMESRSRAKPKEK